MLRRARGSRFRVLLLRAVSASLALIGSLAPLRAQDLSQTYSVAPPPAWVVMESEDQETSDRSAADDEVYLLVDYQANVATEELFVRIVEELRTSGGVQNGSTISVDYDPAYERLTFHHISVTRGGRTSSRLASGGVQLLQRETELEWHMLDGSISAVAVLQDIRPGDRIDYAYTISGRNPVLDGIYSDLFPIGWSVPVAKQRVRVVCPASRALRYRAVGTRADPLVSHDQDTVEYLWELEGLEPITEEDETPSWYASSPWIELSEYADWAEVVRWAVALYPPAELPPPLEELVIQWEEASEAPEARARSALDYVQQEIRYVGLELGVGSYEPRAPQTVYERAFGDCKDKTYLLCALLRRMGIEAFPVLVDSYSRELVAEMLPAPTVFDHVIACAVLGERRVYMDPTQAYQRGPVADRFVPDYRYGLPVTTEQTGLVRFGSHQGVAAQIDIVETFDVSTRDAPAMLTVQTVARGLAAEEFRADLASSRLEEIARSYLDYYAASYPSIESAGELEVKDEAESNVLRTTERYRIAELWVRPEDSEEYEASFFADFIYHEIPMPQTKIRSSPLYVDYPRTVRERIEVNLPEAWSVRVEKSSVKTAAFELRTSCSAVGRRITLEYEYAALASEVPAAEMLAYNKSILNIDEKLGYTLTWGESSEPTGGPGRGTAIAVTAIVGVLIAGAIIVRRRALGR